MAKLAVGVDIGGTNLRFGLVDEHGRILARKRMPTKGHEGVEKSLGRIRQGVAGLIKKAEDLGHTVVGVGVGCPGIISHKDGVVRFSPNMPGWIDVALRSYLEGSFSRPAVVENDANAYALGEAWQGAGRGASSLVCITLGTGVGGGIILDGKVWRGADGMAGEVGHITVNPNGPACPCGNRGCLERYSSATAIVEMAGRALLKGETSVLSKAYRKAPETLTAEAVDKAARSGDLLSRRIYAEAGTRLGIALAGLINLLNVEKIVIGGGMAGAWDLFIGPLRAEVGKRAFEIPAARCEILPGTLGDDAGIIGSAGLVFKGRKA